jgi:hypothetical protein
VFGVEKELSGASGGGVLVAGGGRKENAFWAGRSLVVK